MDTIMYGYHIVCIPKCMDTKVYGYYNVWISQFIIRGPYKIIVYGYYSVWIPQFIIRGPYKPLMQLGHTGHVTYSFINMLFISTGIFYDKYRPQILQVGTTANSPFTCACRNAVLQSQLSKRYTSYSIVYFTLNYTIKHILCYFQGRFEQYFSYIMVVTFIDGGNRCRKIGSYSMKISYRQLISIWRS